MALFHSRLLEVRGDQLTHLEMRNIDELNLNAILLVKIFTLGFYSLEHLIKTHELIFVGSKSSSQKFAISDSSD